MIKVRVQVSNEGSGFSVMVCAESLRKAEQTTKAGYPGSTVSIVFPIESDYFFVSGPHHDGHVGLENSEDAGEAYRSAT